MKTEAPVRTAVAAIAAASLFFSSASADPISVVTDPVGVVTVEIQPGLNSLGFSLLKEPVLSTTVTSNTSGQLTLSTSPNFSNLLTEGKFYYVEVASGNLEGERFEVDVNLTRYGNGSVFLIPNSPLNSTNLIANSLTNERVIVREHLTLGDLTAKFMPALNGSNNANVADQIILQDPISKALRTYYLRGNGIEWWLTDGSSSANSTVIPPNAGVFVRKHQGASTFTTHGQVRNNNFALPFGVGFNLVSIGWPIAASPSSIGATGANGWVGSNNPALADQLMVLNPQTRTIATYYLRGNGLNWRAIGGAANLENQAIIEPGASVLVKRTNADNNYVLINPIQNN
jgi:hypothetical protein